MNINEIEVGQEFKQVNGLNGFPYNRIGETWELRSIEESSFILKNSELCLGVNESELKDYFELVGYTEEAHDDLDNEGKDDKYESILDSETNKVKNDQEVYIFEILPHSYNSVITKPNGSLVEKQHLKDDGSTYRLICNGDVTIVILSDGSKGITKKNSSDRYDAQVAHDIAYMRANIISLEKKIKEVSKTLKAEERRI